MKQFPTKTSLAMPASYIRFFPPCVAGLLRTFEHDWQKSLSAAGTVGSLHHADQPGGSNNNPVLLAREGGDAFHVARSRSPSAPIPERQGRKMKAIDRRVRRLEASLAPQENEEVARLVTLLRERRRRRLEASGEFL